MSRRCLRAALLLMGVSLLSFMLLEAAPGDYFDEIRLNPFVSPKTIDALRREYGLDQPITVRYFRWCASVFRGEWGFSIAYRRPAGPILLERAANTLILTATATTLTWLAALAAVIWAASGKRWRQQLIVSVTAVLVALPDLVIVLGLTMIATRTHWLPSGSMTSIDHASLPLSQRLADSALHITLPVAALITSMAPIVVLHARAALADVLNEPFILSARANGIRRFRLLIRHALPVASNPLITLAGFSIGTLLSAGFVVEAVSGWPGLGNLMLQSILRRDLYVVAGAVMMSAVLVLTGNLITDLLLFVPTLEFGVETECKTCAGSPKPSWPS